MRYFTLDEFDSPDLPGSGQIMDPNFLAMIDEARHIACVPFRINSGVRTEERNRLVGGSSESSHLSGFAADISATTSNRRWIIIEALIQVGFNRIGVADSFVHVDNDPSKARDVMWLY